MAQTVIGIFDNASEAQNAVQELISRGFMRDNIDISNRSATTDDYQGSSYEGRTRDVDDDNDNFGDSISNFFSSLFGGDDDHDKVRGYSEVAKRGSVVTVHVQSRDEAERAADILDEYGAVDVDERATQYRSGMGTAATSDTLNTTNTATTDRSTRDIDETTSIPIIEEQIQVGKRVVETGGARLRSRIVERPVEESLRLRVEHVHVERNPVNRPATEADLNALREGQIEVTEHAEVPVVNKEARVVEEISLSKEVEEREETIRDTVRRTEVDVDEVRNDEEYRRTDDNIRRSDLDLDDDVRRRAND